MSGVSTMPLTESSQSSLANRRHASPTTPSALPVTAQTASQLQTQTTASMLLELAGVSTSSNASSSHDSNGDPPDSSTCSSSSMTCSSMSSLSVAPSSADSSTPKPSPAPHPQHPHQHHTQHQPQHQQHPPTPVAIITNPATPHTIPMSMPSSALNVRIPHLPPLQASGVPGLSPMPTIPLIPPLSVPIQSMAQIATPLHPQLAPPTFYRGSSSGSVFNIPMNPNNFMDDWRKRVDINERISARDRIKKAYVDAKLTYHDLLNLVSSLDEELGFAAATSRMQYLKFPIDWENKVKIKTAAAATSKRPASSANDQVPCIPLSPTKSTSPSLPSFSSPGLSTTSSSSSSSRKRNREGEVSDSESLASSGSTSSEEEDASSSGSSYKKRASSTDNTAMLVKQES